MALTDLGMFASLPDDEEDNQIGATPAPSEVPLPRPRPAEAPPAVTPESNQDLGMFAGVEEEAPKTRDDSFLGATVRAGQNFVRGAIDPVASVPAALELAARAGQNLTGVEGEADIDDTLGFKTTAFLKGLAALVGEADPTDQSLGQQVAAGAGSVVGIGVPAVVAGIFGTPAAGVATGAGLGSASMSVQMFEEARASGADEDTALLYGGVGGVIGLSDILPIGHALKLLPGPLRKEITGQFLSKVTSIAASAGEEAAQEYGQQVAQNLAANGILGQDRQWDEGAMNAAVVGAIVGTGTGTAGAMIPDRKKKGEVVTDNGVSSEQKAALDAVAAPDDVAAVAAAAVPETVDAAPVAPDVAVALETPADKAKRVSKERARKILQEKRAEALTTAPSVAAAEPAPAAAAPVPGADTALVEDVTAASDELVPGQKVYTKLGTPLEVIGPAPGGGYRFKYPGQQKEITGTKDQFSTVEPQLVQDWKRAFPVPNAPEAATEVTSTGNEPVAAAPEETIPTAPESPETITLQRDALFAGKRSAVLYPTGTEAPEKAKNSRFKLVPVPDVGTIEYDSRKVNRATILGAAKLGKLNELLDLGPSNKADVAASIQAGSPEVAVTERTPDGVEVKAAAGTEALAPAQVAALEETKAEPENTVAVETPADVIQGRQEAAPAPAPPEVAPKAAKAKKVSAERSSGKPTGPRLIPDLRTEAREIENQQREWNAEMRQQAREANKGERESAGKNWKVEQREDRQRNNDSATEVVDKFAPLGKTEDAYSGRSSDAVNSRAVIKARAAAMVEAAEAAGIKIPDRVKDGKDDTMNHNAAVVALMEARSLVRKDAPGEADFTRFLTRDRMLRGGARDQVVSERRAEGDQTMSTSGAKSTDNIAAPAVTSEVTVEDGEGEVVSAAAVDPGTGDNDVQTKVGKSARIGVRGLSSGTEARTVKTKSGKVEEVEGAQAASGDKLDADAKKRLIAEMNAKIKAHVTSEVKAIEAETRPKGWDSIEGDGGKAEREALLAKYAMEEGIASGNIDDFSWSQASLEEQLASDQITAGKLADNMLSYFDERKLSGRSVQERTFRQFAPWFMKQISKRLPKLKVLVVKDQYMDLLQPPGVTADAYYRPSTDFVVFRESVLDGHEPHRIAHIFMHEMSHALFTHAIQTDANLKAQIKSLMGLVGRSMNYMKGAHSKPYGLTNVDEFLAEAWSNPDFQKELARIPVSRQWWLDSGMKPPANPLLRNILNWMKQKVADVVDAVGWFDTFDVQGTKRHVSAFDVAMDVGGGLLEVSDMAREAFYRRAMGDDLANVPILAMEAAPKSIGDRLRATGMDSETATDLEQLIKDEFGGTVTDEELAALASEFARPVTSQSDLDAKTAVTPPPGQPAVQEVIDEPNGSEPTKVRAFFLKTMTLDFMRQKYSKLFVRDGKSHLDDFIKMIQRRDAIVNRVADPHDRNAAAYIEFARKSPAEATALADLAMDATRYDVNLGPNADNSHLGVNSKRGLQAKARLKDLNLRYDAMSAEAKKLFVQMTSDYRASHNEAKTKLAGNVLDMLELTLTPTQRADLISKVVNGKLTEADKLVVGSPTIFRALKNAASLRAIQGAYFPQMRFGDHVVITTEAIPKPPLTRLMVFGKAVPVTSEVTGSLVRFSADQSIRGVGAELDRQVSNYVANHDLKSLRVSRRFRDRQTGKFVEKGDQKTNRDYDLTYEVEFQNKGVHYFDKKSDAEKFRKESTSEKTSDVLERRDEQTANVALEGTDVSAIVRRIEGRTDLKAGEKATMKRALEEAVVASMPGNRSPARYQARRNVLGASKDIGRAAATYGKAQGHFIATLETAPKMREAMKGIGAVEADVYHKNAGAVSQVVNELRRRVEGIENPDKPNEIVQTITTISFFDKLVSPAYSMINALQPLQNTLPVLGGRYGNVKTAAAMMSAYNRLGVVGTIGRGIGNTAKSIAQWQKAAIDTSDMLGSIRKKLGPKYDDLINELISRGGLDENAGFEIAQAVMEKRGMLLGTVARFDRAARQMPAAVEAINRVVTAVAAYDLSVASGKSPEKAIQEAYDTTINTQGDYRAVNTPRFMKHGLLAFAMQFRKFALLQTQLYADMYGRIMNGATTKEKLIASKQMANLMTMQVLLGGALGLPGLELIKAGVMLATALGLSDDEWEDWTDRASELLAEVTDGWLGQDGSKWSDLITKGVITRALGVDVSSRMSQADMWTGFGPQDYTDKGVLQYIGGIFAGPPGQTVLDWTVKAPAKLKEGKTLEALELWLPIKVVADTVKAYRGVEAGEMDIRDATLQSIGFRSATPIWSDVPATAEKADAKSKDYNVKADFKKEADDLRAAYKAATTNGEKARIKSLIRGYNKRKKPEGVGNISLDNLTKPKKDTDK